MGGKYSADEICSNSDKMAAGVWVCCGAVSRKAQELNLIIQKALDQCMVDQAPPTASTAAILPKADTSIPNPRRGIPFDVST